MRFMVIVQPGDTKGYEGGKMPEPAMLERMGKFNEELVKAGVMLSGDGLHPSSKGVRIAFAKGGKKTVTDGPFTEARELVGGYWIWQVKSKEEAVEWARRAPMEDNAVLELRQLFEPEDFGEEIAAQERKLLETIEKRQNS